MRIINCVAKWPGAVHDARILRESPLFAAFESARKPFAGVLLGDSGYMLRDWLLTPILNPHTPKEQEYIDALCVTRCTVERCIGVLKRRWHCLHGEIRLATRSVCKVITACVVLHNRATSLGLAPPEGEEAAPAQPRPQFNPPPRAPVDYQPTCIMKLSVINVSIYRLLERRVRVCTGAHGCARVDPVAPPLDEVYNYM